MTHTPTGRLECTPDTPTLIFERKLDASIEDVWANLTMSDRTEQWIGNWSGESGAGNSIEVVWLAEEGTPSETIKILACDPPRRLALAGGPDPDKPWLMTIELRSDNGGTTLEFRQLMANGLSPALVGTGWEFYLDRFTGALAGDTELPVWDERYQQLQHHYEELQAAMALCGEG